MMNRRRITGFFSLAIVLSFAIHASASASNRSDVSAIVERFSPEFGPTRGEIHKCFATVASGGPQLRNAIVAAYADDQQGRFRLLIPSRGTYLVAYDMEIASADTFSCSVELIDVDGDGVDEVKITFASRHSELTDWILKIHANQLISLGPTATNRDGRLMSLLRNSVLLDVKHNGTLQVIGSPPEIEERDSGPKLYVLQSGRYQVGEPLLFHQAIADVGSEADIKIGEFNLPPSLDGPFKLIVVGRAEKSEAEKVRGTISVNGLEVVSHKSLRDLSVRLENLIVGTNQIALKLDRDSEGSSNQDNTTELLNVLVLRESPSK